MKSTGGKSQWGKCNLVNLSSSSSSQIVFNRHWKTSISLKMVVVTIFSKLPDGKVAELNDAFVSVSSFVIFHLTANKKLLDTGRVPWCSSVEKPEFVHLIFSQNKLKTMMTMAWWANSVLLFKILPANTFPLLLTISIFWSYYHPWTMLFYQNVVDRVIIWFFSTFPYIPVFSFCLN